MVTEQIEVAFDEDEGFLRIDCADEQFARIRDDLVARVPEADRLNLLRDHIRCIAVRRRPAPDEAPPRPPGRGFRLALIALALALSLVIQVLGVVYIVQTLWNFRF